MKLTINLSFKAERSEKDEVTVIFGSPVPGEAPLTLSRPDIHSGLESFFHLLNTLHDDIERNVEELKKEIEP